jgi:hypothetical protein
MRFRFRIGPFTFGKGGTRLSLWKGGTGISIPLSKKKGHSFGKISLGPVSAYFGGSSRKATEKKSNQVKEEKIPLEVDSSGEAAIEAFSADQQLINKLQNTGVPWRGVQECLKEALPEHINNRNDVAYRLGPRAMDTVFGKQNIAWRTEKRPSRSGKGYTTWIVII